MVRSAARTVYNANNMNGRHTGLARPSNVIDVASESGQGSHSAPFPRALVEFFVKAFSDAGDVVFDPFMGSGTTMAAAHLLDRKGYGCEISPGYCDVIVRRMMNLGLDAMLESNGDSFAGVASQRGVDPEQALNMKAQDSGAIKHHGPNPHSRRPASRSPRSRMRAAVDPDEIRKAS